MARKPSTASYSSREWIQDKIADGDLNPGLASSLSGTSIFDPVLCELCYRWFAPPGGLVLDPFAGGSVRGIVASKLGRRYMGVDLSGRQIEANRQQASRICTDPVPQWIEGDSRELRQLTAGQQADFVFSCPPYMDLEVYSDDPRDISAMSPDAFRAAHAAIIKAACDQLQPDRFAVWVVGEVRDSRGMYYGLVPDTIMAFKAAGMDLYNEAILVTSVGSLPIRVARQFEGARKLGKTHQNVLVFVKGDPRIAAAAIGDCEFADIQNDATPPDK